VSAHLDVAADTAPAGSSAAITYLDAIHEALAGAMRDDPRVFLLGEDIGHFGGAFGVTRGLWEEFGDDRVLDTPIAEEGFVGAAIGAAWMGQRPVVELQFADFVSCAFDMLVTVAAKTHWRSGIRLPLVVRAPFGGGVRGGPFHSACPEGWFVGVAGLKVVCPGTVDDAYGLLRSAIEDDDPVLFFEHKALYRRLRGDTPDARHRVPLGRARIAREGNGATVVTYAGGVDLALRAAEGLDVEIVDLRTVWPFDRGAVLESVGRTSRLLVLQEASRSSGVAGQILALVSGEGFELLDAPPRVVAPPDTPVPFAPELEDAFIPSVERVRAELVDLLGY
jgi:2-oxoisovalerate dehydrogenase E1 component beta subunit